MELSEKDYQQIKEHGFELSDIEKQLQRFRDGFPYTELVEPALAGKGILVMNDAEIKEHSSFFDDHHNEYKLLKFVPASGAATRMFKDLYEYINNKSNTDIVSDAVAKFFNYIKDFAFFDDLKFKMLENNVNIDECIQNNKISVIIEYLLSEKGLGYSKLPKALLKFHKYGNYSRTALEEHIVEAALYAVNIDKTADIHFTVFPDHFEIFQKHAVEFCKRYKDIYNVNFNIGFSIQKPHTDTIAVDLNNNPFREDDGKLYFRPGGHGALLENLNELQGDIVFIKNIDNVVHESNIDITVLYKKTLAGYLMSLKNSISEYLKRLNNDNLSNEDYINIVYFASDKLQIKIPDGFKEWPLTAKNEFLKRRLNRPIRICGMVKNTGEPGGGPFWIKDRRGEITLQIVEASQVDLNNDKQSAIFNAATHFNPVDIVCSLKDYNGNNYDLKNFVDNNAGFITIKSKNGKSLKAMELPGLWNGSMAEWITIFVEVPIETFNPVKTVIDLLRPQHQASKTI